MTRSAGTTRRRAALYGGAASLLILGYLYLVFFSSFDLPRPGIEDERDRSQLLEEINTAIANGVAFLESQQSPDGAWRSQTYGFMKDGITLTPHVLSATVALPESMTSESTARGVDYLLAIDPDTAVLLQPVYTAAETSWVLRLAGHEQAADPWLDLIEAHQLTEQLGWPRSDPRYGGWSYATTPPVYHPDAVDPTRPDANLSATVFAVGALKLAGRLSDEQAAAARDFAFIVQALKLGGFWFSPTDPARNKAGRTKAILVDPTEHPATQPLLKMTPRPLPTQAARPPRGWHLPKYNPYGSATADGVRVLLACGVDQEIESLATARAWLVKYFDPSTVPGDFTPDREPLRHGYYHYYAWSVSHALRRLGVTHAGADRSTPWAEKLAAALIATQDADGAWRNASTDGKEDDPLVATPFALSALAVCRNALMEMPSE